MALINGLVAAFILGSILTLNSCFGSNESSGQRERNADTAAGKAGQAAHKVAKEGEKAAKEINKKLDQAAREARDGWQKAAQDDKSKGK